MPSEISAASLMEEENPGGGNNNDDDDDDDDVMEVEAVVESGDEEDEEGDTGDDAASSSVDVVVAPTAAVKSKPPQKKKAAKKKSKKASSTPTSPATFSSPLASSSPSPGLLAHARSEAAREAQAALAEQVPTLPMHISETAVRSFGRLLINKSSSFCSTRALYPLGFSCDRYEFSPVHGRVLQLRCMIDKDSASGSPLFRMVWGPGIDQEQDPVDVPFYPSLHAPPHTQNAAIKEALARQQQSSTTTTPPTLMPSPGMQVKVRFDDQKYHYGIVQSVAKNTKKQPRNKKGQVEMTVQYTEDEFQETFTFPDPDVVLLMPGEEDTSGRYKQKSADQGFYSVTGKTPIEAWGQLLIKMGMIDEIMYERAMESLEVSRKEGMQEAMEKMENKSNNKRKESESATPSRVPSPVESSITLATKQEEGKEDVVMADGEDVVVAVEEEDDKEPPSQEELMLLEQAASLEKELEEAMEQDEQATLDLCNARITHLGPFLCNPFQNDEQSRILQASWLATAVRKEKTRMGSTGNKKKVVTAVDLLERNDSIANTDIEALIEGLPGSEFCDSYVFQAFRTGGGLSRSWVHEAQLKNEKESLQRLEDQQAKEEVLQERAAKRKQKEDLNATRKRQRLEEEDEKKRARADERLARLQIQVSERLEKEAAGQREKVVQSFSRSLVREYNRRRKTAEIVAAQMVIEGKGGTTNTMPLDGFPPLPNPSKVYNEDVMRIWNFVSTFGDFFVAHSFTDVVPSLDMVQDAIDTVAKSEVQDSPEAEDAARLLTQMAETLTKPLGSRVTRILFASLVALAPALQKDFGAAFFNEVNAAKDDAQQEKKKGSQNKQDFLVPVNSMTWKEAARQMFVADALGELGLQRHEVSHLLRGYRSAGHPNSKESRRLRKVEDYPTALVLQDITEAERTDDAEILNANCLRIDLPCAPLRPGSSPSPQDLHHSGQFPNQRDKSSVNFRNGSGLFDLEVSRRELKELVARREQYMEDALTLKEEMERQRLKEQGEDIEEDDDDDEDDDTKSVSSGSAGMAMAISQEGKYAKSSVVAEEGGDSAPSVIVKKGEDAVDSVVADEGPTVIVKKEEDAVDSAIADEGEGTTPSSVATEGRGSIPSPVAEEGQGATPSPVVEEGTDAVPNAMAEDRKDAKPGSTAEVKDPTQGGLKEEDVMEVEPLVNMTGKETPYDDFCGDVPDAPDLLRRCLAVLRAVSISGPAEHFLYPVDPQTNPGYYDAILRPMCLREAGKQLNQCAEMTKKLQSNVDEFVENAVARFGQNIRLIGHNSLTYSNAGPTIVAAGTEMIRLFERLFFHWVLAPEHLLPKLSELDDEKCVQQHPSDEGSTVLLCDGCEGKYNVARLDPPLREIPKGDWYCSRCVSGYWWGDVDPRIGKLVQKGGSNVDSGSKPQNKGCVTKCMYSYPQKSFGEPSLRYRVEFGDGFDEIWSLEEVNKALERQNDPAPRIRCLKAVVESPGYAFGIDSGLRIDLVPTTLNTKVSDAACRMAVASSEFRDTIAAASSLLTTDPSEMTAKEWLRLLVLLVTKSAACDLIQNHAGKLENEAAERMAKAMDDVKRVQLGNLNDILPSVPTDDEDIALMTPFKRLMEASTPIAVATETHPVQDPLAQKTKSAPASLQSGSVAVVDVGSVEVVDVMEIEKGSSPMASANAAILAVEKENPFTQSNGKKGKRQKVLEDSFAAYFIKNQMKPTVASFSEDSFSPSADALLSPQDPQLSFASLRCRGITCVFCGLTDSALGCPLVRVPDEQEWELLMAHTSRARRIHLIAQMPKERQRKLCSVTITLGGELFSAKDSDLNWCKDGGMLEFPLRAKSGFQNELKFRYETGLPFLTGSLSAHDCCAAAAHNARKERVLQKFKDERGEYFEREEGLISGRTLEIGRDALGRSYWKFAAMRESLFVYADGLYKFYPAPENIASVIVGLKKDPVVKKLSESFPKAKVMVADRSWTNLLFRQRFPNALKAQPRSRPQSPSRSIPSNEPTKEIDLVFKVNDGVLVQSKDGTIFWNATIVQVQKEASSETNVVGLLVEYTEWGAEFREWVSPKRVLEPTSAHLEKQTQLLHDRSTSKFGLPPVLQFLHAKDFLWAKDRSRGSLPLPDFGRIMKWKNDHEKTFCIAKTALLAMEAALPIGAVDTREKGRWRSDYVAQWRLLVVEAEGPVALMKCVFHFEGALSEEWYKEFHIHVRTALPMAWKSIADASPSSIVMRLVVLDRALQYKKVDKKRFARRKRK